LPCVIGLAVRERPRRPRLLRQRTRTGLGPPLDRAQQNQASLGQLLRRRVIEQAGGDPQRLRVQPRDDAVQLAGLESVDHWPRQIVHADDLHYEPPPPCAQSPSASAGGSSFGSGFGAPFRAGLRAGDRFTASHSAPRRRAVLSSTERVAPVTLLTSCIR